MDKIEIILHSLMLLFCGMGLATSIAKENYSATVWVIVSTIWVIISAMRCRDN